MLECHNSSLYSGTKYLGRYTEEGPDDEMRSEMCLVFGVIGRWGVAGINQAALFLCKRAVVRFAVFSGCLFLCLSNATVSAQYRFDSWTTDNGLPQNSVLSILQTRDGYLWLTTYDGLVRFDGVRFTIFNKGNSKGLAGNRLRSLFAEADDTLWLGEDSGLVRFRNGQFQTFTTADGLPSNEVNGVLRDLDGSLLILMPNWPRALARRTHHC